MFFPLDNIETPIQWENTPEFWNTRYQEQTTRWNQGVVSPRLKKFYEREGYLKLAAGSRIAVLGCGHGHEAGFFAQHGYNVTAIDFSAEAIREAKTLYPMPNITFLEANVFALPEELFASFDAVIEYTFFCAIHPEERLQYLKTVTQLLKPSGAFIGALWLRDEASEIPAEPPFRLSRQEVDTWFLSRFIDVRTYDFPEMESWRKLPLDEVLATGQRSELVVVLCEPRDFAS